MSDSAEKDKPKVGDSLAGKRTVEVAGTTVNATGKGNPKVEESPAGKRIADSSPVSGAPPTKRPKNSSQAETEVTDDVEGSKPKEPHQPEGKKIVFGFGSKPQV